MTTAQVARDRSFTTYLGVIRRHQATRGRIIAILGIGLFFNLVALAIGASAEQKLIQGASFMNQMGFTLVLPLISLVFASSALGDLNDDRTMVYLWMAPARRWKLALAAVVSSVTIAFPLLLVVLLPAAAMTGAGLPLIGGTAVAAFCGCCGYCGIFAFFGVRFKRALVWGMVYITIWESFVTTASESAARLSVRAYTASALSQYTGVGLRLGTLTLASAILVPFGIMIAFTWLTGRTLTRAKVD